MKLLTDENIIKEFIKLYRSLICKITNIDSRMLIFSLIFYRYSSTLYETEQKIIEDQKSEIILDKDECDKRNIFYIPLEISWNRFVNFINKSISYTNFYDFLYTKVKKLNPEYPINGIICSRVGSDIIEDLKKLVLLINELDLSDTDIFHKDWEEFFIKLNNHFNMFDQHINKLFIYNSSISKLMVNLVKPKKIDKIYNPGCGYGQVLVDCFNYIKQLSNTPNKSSMFYGEDELNNILCITTINLIINGVDKNKIDLDLSGLLLEKLKNNQKFNIILSQATVDQNLKSSRLFNNRWSNDVSLKNSNLALLQHLIFHLEKNGRCAIVLSSTSLTSNVNSEKNIRKNIIESGNLKGLILLPKGIFYGVKTETVIWFLSKDQSSNKILLIDVRCFETLENKGKNIELSLSDIELIQGLFEQFKRQESIKENNYCKILTNKEIEEKDYDLTPSLYLKNQKLNESINTIRNIIGKDVKIKSLANYLSIVMGFHNMYIKKNGPNSKLFFRGQQNKNWSIYPSVFRNNNIYNEYTLIRESLFRMPNEFSNLKTEFEKLTKLQHYGLPTRLLDVTTNPLVALYFACKSDDNNKNEDGIVYFKSEYPKQYNENEISILCHLPFIEPHISINDFIDELDNYNLLPLKFRKKNAKDISAINKLIEDIIKDNYYIISNYSNERIRCQSGAFLLVGQYKIMNNHIENGEVHNNQDYFEKTKIIIPHNKKCEILKELDICNINEASLFPELEHMIGYLKEEN